LAVRPEGKSKGKIVEVVCSNVAAVMKVVDIAGNVSVLLLLLLLL